MSAKQLMIAINKQMPSMQMKDMKNKPEDNIKRLAAGLGIPLSIEEEELESKGWAGQAKGLIQILWEHEWIDDTKNPNKHYTISGQKDLFGNIILGTSLQDLIDKAPDFQNKVTLLQEKLGQLGVTVHCSPKYHAKLAGEGIEYSWGFSKKYIDDYQSVKREQKKSFAKA